MARRRHYSPEIHRPLVSILYHEAKHRRVPMTSLTNQLLEQALTGGPGWHKAQEAYAALSLHDQPADTSAPPHNQLPEPRKEAPA